MAAAPPAKAPAATLTATPGEPSAPAGGRKKLMMIIGAAVLALLLIGGGIAFWLVKSRPAPSEDGEEAAAPAAHQPAGKHDAKGQPPQFMPLDPFTVNLADKDGERFAQVAITFELEDSHFADQIRAYLPAVRNNILMTLAQKTAAELLTREGKELLAKQILRESLRPMGIEVPDEEEGDEHAEAARPKKKGKKKKAPVSYPIRSVQFASFIIQ